MIIRWQLECAGAGLLPLGLQWANLLAICPFVSKAVLDVVQHEADKTDAARERALAFLFVSEVEAMPRSTYSHPWKRKAILSKTRPQLEIEQSLQKLAVEKHIGEGATAMVYRAKEADRFRVALKRTKRPQEYDKRRPIEIREMQAFQDRQDILREAEMLWGLVHPHIAQVHHVYDTQVLAGYTLDLADSTCETMVQQCTLMRVLETVQQLAQALEYLQHASVLHRDIKPSNILIMAWQPHVCIKVSDFGDVLQLPAPLDTNLGAYYPPDRLGMLDLRRDA